ncbi:MAG TPA: hypothetical protein VI685_11865 [Candidatus Angelobacter sp.]
MRVPHQPEKHWERQLRAAIPCYTALATSVFLHIAALAALVLLRHAVHPHVQLVKYEEVQLQSGPVYRPLNTAVGHGQGHPARTRQRPQLPRPEATEATEILDPGQPLHEQAKRWTSAMTMSLNFHGVYRNHVYQLAVLVSGDPPVISVDELPPHFQQYVIIEVTIDTKGRAAEVRKVAGEVDTKIEEKLLAAIRKFRYIPARRDGLAIPSQRDIVIHIPT